MKNEVKLNDFLGLMEKCYVDAKKIGMGNQTEFIYHTALFALSTKWGEDLSDIESWWEENWMDFIKKIKK